MSFVRKKPRKILITGASSGIGEALALYYAAQQDVILALSGRNAERLEQVAENCRKKGAVVFTQVVDVTDRGAMAQWIYDIDDRYPLDLVIANAGISGGTGGYNDGESADQVRQIFDVNVTGVFNTIDPIISRMVARKSGQVGIMSSLASFGSWPGAPAYSASKAAVRIYGEALHGAMKHTGVKINVICPGFVKTPMTDVNDYMMPFMINVGCAARIIAKGLLKNRVRIAFPFPSYLLAGLIGLMPPCISLRLLLALPEKPRQF